MSCDARRCELRHFPDGIVHAVVWREQDGDPTVLRDIALFALGTVSSVRSVRVIPEAADDGDDSGSEEMGGEGRGGGRSGIGGWSWV